jgi:hypothetical protein
VKRVTNNTGNESYERLAKALEALPGGFPETPSRVEFQLLKKGFTGEEAELTGCMSRKYETVSEVARRTHKPEAKVKSLLDDLLPRRLIRQRVFNCREEYRLGPFILGWYEALMGHKLRNDVEFATLFEQYMKEGGGASVLCRHGLVFWALYQPDVR